MREYVIEPTALERGMARAIGSVAYYSNGFQSVACFRLRKIEIRLELIVLQNLITLVTSKLLLNLPYYHINF
jgi:hypothetical protein